MTIYFVAPPCHFLAWFGLSHKLYYLRILLALSLVSNSNLINVAYVVAPLPDIIDELNTILHTGKMFCFAELKLWS